MASSVMKFLDWGEEREASSGDGDTTFVHFWRSKRGAQKAQETIAFFLILK